MNPIFSRNDSVRLSDTAASAHSSGLFDGPDAPRTMSRTLGPSNRPTVLADDAACRPRCGNSPEDGVDLAHLLRGPLGRPSAQPSAVPTDDPTSRPRCGNFPEDGIDLGPQAQEAADRLRRQANRVLQDNLDIVKCWSRDFQPGLDSSADQLGKEADEAARLLRALTQAHRQRA
jgi:hypothetical protein